MSKEDSSKTVAAKPLEWKAATCGLRLFRAPSLPMTSCPCAARCRPPYRLAAQRGDSGRNPCVRLARDLDRAGLTEHREDQLQVAHVVAQVVAGLHRAQALELLVRARRHAKTKFQLKLTCTQVMSSLKVARAVAMSFNP